MRNIMIRRARSVVKISITEANFKSFNEYLHTLRDMTNGVEMPFENCGRFKTTAACMRVVELYGWGEFENQVFDGLILPIPTN